MNRRESTFANNRIFNKHSERTWTTFEEVQITKYILGLI